jgi:hypothetical protein
MDVQLFVMTAESRYGIRATATESLSDSTHRLFFSSAADAGRLLAACEAEGIEAHPEPPTADGYPVVVGHMTVPQLDRKVVLTGRQGLGSQR